MNQKQSTPASRRFVVMAAVTIAAIALTGAGVWLFAQHLSANSSMPAVQIRWTPLLIGGLIVAVFVVILLHSIHEEHVTSRTVADALRGREPLTDEEFGLRYYPTDLAPLAAQLRRILADNLGCDLSAMIPPDDFEKWLDLFPGLDSAADSFFEEIAIEFQLTRDCPWPKRFGTFDALVRFLAQHARPPEIH
jgi:hypothetical protein